MDIVCYSHLRWNFVFQRPQHLMVRAADNFRVFYIEEVIYGEGEDVLSMVSDQGVQVMTPFLNKADPGTASTRLAGLLDNFFAANQISEYIAWYYTPMALQWHHGAPPPTVTVYDCMDELTAFKNAPPELKSFEKELFSKAQLVFTGGISIYEEKKKFHSNVFAFPSSIDKEHFKKARGAYPELHDQQFINRPRIGFFGVIDERMDLLLLEGAALAKPDWNFILIGPVVKIDPATLPALPNIHYLGMKKYDELPSYLAGWDVAMMPFAINESTRFISPTKTPEYLAGGKPVVSTAVVDVQNTYEKNGLVYISKNLPDFIAGLDWALQISKSEKWLKAVDRFLAGMSWDVTWEKMLFQINACYDEVIHKQIKTLP